MSLVYIATLPESMTVADVVSFDVTSASLPRTLLGRRSGLDELIYDAEGGFSDSWKGFSSLTPTDDGFTLVLGRRAFSAAGVAVFFAAGGGSSGGDATSIQGHVITGDGSEGQTLVLDESGGLIWAYPGGGSGGPPGLTALYYLDGTQGQEVGPSPGIDTCTTLVFAAWGTPQNVVSLVAPADTGNPYSLEVVNTGGVAVTFVANAPGVTTPTFAPFAIADGSSTYVLPARGKARAVFNPGGYDIGVSPPDSTPRWWIYPEAVAGAAPGSGPKYRGHSLSAVTIASTSWTGFSSYCTPLDDIQDRITRSGSTLTFAVAGTYFVDFSIGQNVTVSPGLGAYVSLRARSGSTTLLCWFGYRPVGFNGVSSDPPRMGGLITVTAGQAVSFQIVVENPSSGTYTPGTVDGQPLHSMNLCAFLIG